MNNQSTLTQTEYQQKIGKIEKEILKLKKGAGFEFSKKIISLKGIFKGISINEQDIKKSKKSLFKELQI